MGVVPPCARLDSRACCRLLLSRPNALFMISSHSFRLILPVKKSARPVQYSWPWSGVRSSARRSFSETRSVRRGGGEVGDGSNAGTLTTAACDVDATGAEAGASVFMATSLAMAPLVATPRTENGSSTRAGPSIPMIAISLITTWPL